MSELSIISFNVNGLISFMKRRGYTLSTFSKLIENICVSNEGVGSAVSDLEKPDIVCIQECKMSFGEDLNNSTGCPGDYESYFSLTENNKRYSGVATYCLRSTVMVVEAARGFSWLEVSPRQFDIDQRMTSEGLEGLASSISEIKNRYGISLSEIDWEGRCVITDHKHFLLFNLYVPLIRGKAEEQEHEYEHEQESFKRPHQAQCVNHGQEEAKEKVDLERLKYRLAFQEYLDLALHTVKSSCGRRVVLAGDFNIILSRIDCFGGLFVSGEQERKEGELVSAGDILEEISFDKAYSRVRRESIQMIERHDLVDVYRHYYPRVQNKYTCWNQMNQSRVRNQGARIDLFLVSRELVAESVKCEILDHVFGSDHCPVLLVLRAGEVGVGKPPSICSRYLPQCKQRQSTIFQFLASSNGSQLKTQERSKAIKGLDSKLKGKGSNLSTKPSQANPQCKHGDLCVKKKVTKQGVNKGRFYWSCPKSDQQKCNTFVWFEKTDAGAKDNEDLRNFIKR